MMGLTLGKIRGLQQITDTGGIFTICAMDHRGSFAAMIDKNHPETVRSEVIEARKMELCATLGPHSSAVLLDPIYGAAQCINRSALPRGIGLLVSIEATGYSDRPEGRHTGLLEHWGVAQIKRMGAQAVKILVYYRFDLKEAARAQRETVAQVAEDCRKHDIPFLVEPVRYPVGDDKGNPARFAGRKGEMVIQAARDMTALPIDVLKSEFPADLNYEKDEGRLDMLCTALNEATPAPWVVLSAGVNFDTFRRQVEIASRAGASGFLAGRAIWQEAMVIPEAVERRRFLETVAVERMNVLKEIATKWAQPWYRKLGLTAAALTDVDDSWYRRYGNI
jgi:tagatose 1,6-diphosphate aldolase